jgi:hypothetical protein
MKRRYGVDYADIDSDALQAVQDSSLAGWHSNAKQKLLQGDGLTIAHDSEAQVSTYSQGATT